MTSSPGCVWRGAVTPGPISTRAWTTSRPGALRSWRCRSVRLLPTCWASATPSAGPTTATSDTIAMRIAFMRSASFTAYASDDRRNQLLGRDDRPCVLRRADLQECLHVVPSVARDGVLHQRHLVSQLRRMAHRRVDAGVRDEPDDDELVNAVLLELQIQIGVGEPAGAPVLLRDDLAGSRR